MSSLSLASRQPSRCSSSRSPGASQPGGDGDVDQHKNLTSKMRRNEDDVENLDAQSDKTLDYSEDFDNDQVDEDDDVLDEVMFCCNQCSLKFDLSDDLTVHLRTEHARLPNGKLPALEILPEMGEGELTLQRCSFCSFESFFKEDFDMHVRTHTCLRPYRCSACLFASFSADEVDVHVADAHAGDDDVMIIPLDVPYTMSTLDESLDSMVEKQQCGSHTECGLTKDVVDEDRPSTVQNSPSTVQNKASTDHDKPTVTQNKSSLDHNKESNGHNNLSQDHDKPSLDHITSSLEQNKPFPDHNEYSSHKLVNCDKPATETWQDIV